MDRKKELRRQIDGLESDNQGLRLAKARLADDVAEAIAVLDEVSELLVEALSSPSRKFRRPADQVTLSQTEARLSDLVATLRRELDIDSPVPAYTKAQAASGLKSLSHVLVAVASLTTISVNLPDAIDNADTALRVVVSSSNDVIREATGSSDLDEDDRRLVFEAILHEENGAQLWNQLRDDPSRLRELVPDSTLHPSDLNDPDLAGTDLSGLDLSGVNFLRANLSGANLSNTVLNGSDLTDAVLHDVDLRSTRLLAATMIRTQVTSANLESVVLTGSDLTDARLVDVSASGLRAAEVRFVRAHFTDTDLTGASFTAANLTDSRFNQTTASGADFVDSILARAKFEGGSCSDCDFTGSNMDDSQFLGDVDLGGAVMSGRSAARITIATDQTDHRTVLPQR